MGLKIRSGYRGCQKTMKSKKLRTPGAHTYKSLKLQLMKMCAYKCALCMSTPKPIVHYILTTNLEYTKKALFHAYLFQACKVI